MSVKNRKIAWSEIILPSVQVKYVVSKALGGELFDIERWNKQFFYTGLWVWSDINLKPQIFSFNFLTLTRFKTVATNDKILNPNYVFSSSLYFY